MATPEILLTDDQRTEIIQISPNISEYEIVKYYTFSSYDIKIIKKHRRSYNRFGFALQLALLRNPGCTLSYVSNIPLSVLSYIAEQIQADPKEFELYAKFHPLDGNTLIFLENINLVDHNYQVLYAH